MLTSAAIIEFLYFDLTYVSINGGGFYFLNQKVNIKKLVLLDGDNITT